MPLWARVIAGLVAGEIGYYWGHRWSHEIPILWRFHSIHHSAEEIDFLVNTRAHPIDMVFGRLCGLVPIYVLGLGGPFNAAASAVPGGAEGGVVAVAAEGSLVPVIVTLIGTVWGFFIHANVRWRFGPLEWLISSPAFHHWHHTRSGPINHNYASTLPWLDRIFGTHYLPRNELPTSYGLDAPMPDHLVDQLFYPLSPPAHSPAVRAPDAVDVALSLSSEESTSAVEEVETGERLEALR